MSDQAGCPSAVAPPTVRPPTNGDPRFAEYRRTRDRALRNELIEEHSRLAEALARRFTHHGEAPDDLRQVALVGLLKAVERFEPGRGVQFSSFATPTILGELKRHFRDKGWAVRVPRRLQELHLEVGSLIAMLSQELHRVPTTAELAERVGVSEEAVLEAMEARSLYRLTPLDADRSEDSSPVEWHVGIVDPGFERADDRVTLRRLLRRLPEHERQIVYLRFFTGLSQSEIAAEIGLSQMHVSRLLGKSLLTLSASLERPDDT